MCFFTTEKGKLPATVGRDSTVSIEVSTVLATSVKPDLSREKMIDRARHFFILSVQSLELLDAYKEMVKFYDGIHNTTRIGGLRASVPLLVVEILAGHCLLGTLFTDQQVYSIKPVV